MIVEIGEKVHIIERRNFENEVRRHFIGEVTRVSERAIRLLGYLWAFDRTKGEYVRKTDVRERVIYPGERHLINVLPPDADLAKCRYITDAKRGLGVTDGSSFFLEITEFTAMR
jgi:hypothetical protein